MKAVNQSIGRSVRHQQDYASVFLLDHRYQRDNVRNALPNWLQPSLQVHTSFGSAFSQLNKVYFCINSRIFTQIGIPFANYLLN